MFIVKLKECRRGLKASYFDASSSKQAIDCRRAATFAALNRDP
jgi:hypothetical protein